MPYLTATELRNRMIRHYDAIYKDSVTGLVDNAKAEADIDAASARIDSYLGRLYQVPVTSEKALAVVREWCGVLAEEKARARSANREVPDSLLAAIRQVLRELELAGKGELTLAGAERLEAAGPSIQGDEEFPFVKADAPVFGRKSLKGF
jgi:phage gp36-like protein